jgi:Spy/CpxP family protein refolding chaperone
MKKILNITALLVLLMVVASQVAAQSKMTEEQKNEAKAEYQAYKEKLNLTEEQSKKVDAINSDWLEGLAGIKNSNAGRMAKYRKYKALKSDRDKKMKEVLTRDQYKIYQQQQQEMKDEFQERRANRE